MWKQVFQLLQNRPHHQRVSARVWVQFENFIFVQIPLWPSWKQLKLIPEQLLDSSFCCIFHVLRMMMAIPHHPYYHWPFGKKSRWYDYYFGISKFSEYVTEKDKTYGGDWCPDDYYHILKFESCPRQLCVAVSLFTNIRVEIWHCYLIRTYTRVNC